MIKNLLSTILSCVMLVLSLLLCIGVKTFFSACDHKTEAGMWMSCHWAEQAVFAAGIALSCTALIAVILKDRRVRLGLAAAMIPTVIMTMLIPNILINLCMKTDMRCHSVMRPAVLILCALIAAAAAVTVIVNRKKAE